MSGPTGFFKKIGAEQGANDPNTRQRIIMAVQEWTASRKHFSEKLRLVVWWQWLMLTPADNVAARLPHELVHRLDDALAMQQRQRRGPCGGAAEDHPACQLSSASSHESEGDVKALNIRSC